jgi:hypothetical protein
MTLYINKKELEALLQLLRNECNSVPDESPLIDLLERCEYTASNNKIKSVFDGTYTKDE